MLDGEVVLLRIKILVLHTVSVCRDSFGVAGLVLHRHFPLLLFLGQRAYFVPDLFLNVNFRAEEVVTDLRRLPLHQACLVLVVHRSWVDRIQIWELILAIARWGQQVEMLKLRSEEVVDLQFVLRISRCWCRFHPFGVWHGNGVIGWEIAASWTKHGELLIHLLQFRVKSFCLNRFELFNGLYLFDGNRLENLLHWC